MNMDKEETDISKEDARNAQFQEPPGKCKTKLAVTAHPLDGCCKKE